METAVFSLTGYRFSHIELNLEHIPADTHLTLDFSPKGEYLEEDGIYNLNFLKSATIIQYTIKGRFMSR